MFVVVNVMLVVAALVLVLVIAATSSIPGRQPQGAESPDGDWIGSTDLSSLRTARGHAPERSTNTLSRRVAAAGMQ